MGYSENDYREILEKVSGKSFEDYFLNNVNGTKPYDNLINESLEYLGLELIHKPSTSFAESKLGFRIVSKGKNAIVQSIYPGSPSDIGGLRVGDEIIALNCSQLNNDLDKWLKYFENDDLKLSVYRDGKLLGVTLITGFDFFYPKFEVKQIKNITESQLVNLKFWGEDGI